MKDLNISLLTWHKMLIKTQNKYYVLHNTIQ